MRLNAMGSARRLPRALFTIACIANFLVIVVLTGCASQPVPVAAAPKGPTRAEQIVAALNALSFEQHDDGWYLSLPAPLVFQFDSDIVSADANKNLVRIAHELRSLGINQVLVRGHTDTVGSHEYNLGLSKRRADAVARVLSDGGYPLNSIDAKGMSSSVPIADNSTSEGRAQNRRVVLIVQVDALAAK